MTLHFVQEFRKREKCAVCSEAPAESKSLCPGHLRRARLEFRSWSAARRARGMCIECSSGSITGQLRCTPHRERNRLRALNWTRSHRDWQQFKEAFRRFTALDLGLCSGCARRPTEAGGTRCSRCRKKQRGYAANGRRGFGC